MTSTPDEMQRLVQAALDAERGKRRKERREQLRTIAIVATPIVTAIGVILTVIFTR